MRLRGDDRAVTVQVGAVLLLGILVISLSIFQATVVPNENEQVEFQHNQLVQEDMQSFRSAVTRAGGAGLTQSVAVRLGTQYPERAVLINPPPATGTLQTGDSGDIEIRNAKALDDETADYWTGTDTDDRTFETNSVSYVPDYSVYQNAPTTVYEGSVLYNRFDGDTTAAQSQQSVVDGRTISLVAVDGELSRSQLGAVAVDVRPKSVSERTIAVEDGANPITVAIPSALTEETWRDELLAEEYDTDGADGGSDDGRYVTGVTKTGGIVELTFEAGYQYNLNLAKVGVGTGVDDAATSYLTIVSGDGETVAEGSDQQLVVEVRDEYNNPVSGVTVSASSSGVGSLTSTSAVTGSDGRAVFTYSSPVDVDDPQSATVTADIGPSAAEQVTFDLTVADSDGSGNDGGGGDGGGPDDINPNSDDAVILGGAQIVESSCSDGVKRQSSIYCNVDVTLENLDDNNAQSVDLARFNFYDIDATSNNDRTDAPRAVKIIQASGDTKLDAANSGGRYESVSPQIEVGAGASETIRLRFFADTNAEQTFDVERGDFFVFSVIFDNGRTATYFVAPEGDGGGGGDGNGNGNGNGN